MGITDHIKVGYLGNLHNDFKFLAWHCLGVPSRLSAAQPLLQSGTGEKKPQRHGQESQRCFGQMFGLDLFENAIRIINTTHHAPRTKQQSNENRNHYTDEKPGQLVQNQVGNQPSAAQQAHLRGSLSTGFRESIMLAMLAIV